MFLVLSMSYLKERGRETFYHIPVAEVDRALPQKADATDTTLLITLKVRSNELYAITWSASVAYYCGMF